MDMEFQGGLAALLVLTLMLTLTPFVCFVVYFFMD